MNELAMEAFRLVFISGILSVTRITMASLVVPFLGGETIQLPVRASIIASLGLVLFPIIAPTIPSGTISPFTFVAIFIKEATLGLLYGYMASKIFWVALGVGLVVDNQRGASIAEAFDPSINEQVSPLGQFTLQSMIALFYTSGGFLLFLAGLFESYAAWPVFDFFPIFNEGFVDFFLHQVDQVVKLTVVLAAPLMITLFVTEFGLGLINRFAPQLNVFFLAMPIKSLVAFVVLIFYLPYFLDYLLRDDSFSRIIVDQLQTVIQ
ncbi:type III secretion system export apparatus subunit SctT [Bremerella sp. JC770]|uniref:type III secretion system export apparatus subunit SctT n=1 Tax=Bremerella sp. JC770 TaxID=3232137 RepID=UPI003458417A